MTTLGRVADWMTREPLAVTEETSLSRVMRLMRAEGIRHVLVMQGDRLAGIFSTRDVQRLLPSVAPCRRRSRSERS